MNKILLALALSMSGTSWADSEWLANDAGFVVREADETNDVMGVNPCNEVLVFMAPGSADKNGQKVTVPVMFRVDHETPWQSQVQVRYQDDWAISTLKLDSRFLGELLAGAALRIKWAPGAYSRFNLQGLTAALDGVKCDKEYFDESDKDRDADYFL